MNVFVKLVLLRLTVPNRVNHHDVLAGSQRNVFIFEIEKEVIAYIRLDKSAISFPEHDVEHALFELHLLIRQPIASQPIALLAHRDGEDIFFVVDCGWEGELEPGLWQGGVVVGEVVERA